MGLFGTSPPAPRGPGSSQVGPGLSWAGRGHTCPHVKIWVLQNCGVCMLKDSHSGVPISRADSRGVLIKTSTAQQWLDWELLVLNQNLTGDQLRFQNSESHRKVTAHLSPCCDELNRDPVANTDPQDKCGNGQSPWSGKTWWWWGDTPGA